MTAGPAFVAALRQIKPPPGHVPGGPHWESAMLIGIPRETRTGETRVAATPETVKKLAASDKHEIDGEAPAPAVISGGTGRGRPGDLESGE